MRVATLACIHFHPDFFHNAYGYFVIPNITQTDSETEQVDFVKHEENNMPPNKKPRLNMDWFDDVVLVATEGPKFGGDKYNIIKPVHI
jgi:hypothetical protein